MRKTIGTFLLLGAAAAAQSVYQDPDGHFSAPVPAGWQSAKVPNRAATASITKGKAFVNLSVEPGSTAAADAMKNYEKVVAQNCPGYHELERGPATLAGVSGLSLRFTCSDPKQGFAAMSVAMASRNGELIFFYASTPADEYDVMKSDIQTIRSGFRLTTASAPAAASGDAQKLAPLEKACAAGVFTPEECSAKRKAFGGGGAAPAVPAPPAGGGAQVYRDPRGRFSVTAPAGWTASPMGDSGADGVQLSHGTAWTAISPFGGGVSGPGDVVNSIANQVQPQYKNLQLMAHNVFKVGAHDAAYAMFTGTNSKGVEVSLTVSGIAAGGGHFLALISSVPMTDAQAISPALTEISQSIRFDGQ